MLTFKQYIKENFLLEEYESSNFKGILHENLVGNHLHPNQKMEHYRNEKSQKSPSDIIGEAKKSPEDFDAADKRAKGAADAIRAHLKTKHEIHDHHFNQVFWTSNKSDHKKLSHHVLNEVEKDKNATFRDGSGNEINRKNIGDHEEDENNNADIMIHSVRHYDKNGKPIHKDEYKPEEGHTAVHTLHGVSLKVGSAKPNLANPGIDTLDKLTKSPEGNSQKFLNAHKKKMEELGYTGTTDTVHARYKKNRDSSNPDEKENAAAADRSKRATMNNMATNYSNSFNELPHEHQHKFITSLMGEKTKHHVFKAWTETDKPTAKKKKGDTQHVSDHIDDLHNELGNHPEGFHSVSSGQSIYIHAKPKGWKPGQPLTDSKGKAKGKRIGIEALKGGSGPGKGFNGTTKSSVN